jgi:hypothetical protein
MADQSGGEGWWIASDGKWYPPELHPDYRPPAAPVAPPVWVAPQQPTAPSYTSAPPPSPPPLPPAFAPGRPSAPASKSRTPLVVGGGIALAALLGIGAFVIPSGGDGDDTATSRPSTATAAPTGDAATPTDAPPVEATAAPTDAPTESATEAPTEAASEPPATDAPATEVPGGEVGAAGNPAAFGEEFELTPDWRATILGGEDATAAGLVDDFSDPAPAGSLYWAIRYRVTYLGSEPFAFDASSVQAVGSGVYESFDSDCFLDSTAVEATGARPFAPEFVPGQTVEVVSCVTVPESELSELTYNLVNFNSTRGDLVFAAEGADAADLPPPPDTSAHQADLQGRALPFGQDLEFGAEWTATALVLEAAADSGLLAEGLTPPPDGLVYAVIRYRATYNGTEADVTDPFFVRALGSQVFGTSNSFGCFLDSAATEAAGLADNFGSYSPGETKEAVVCLAVPEAELGSVVVAITSVSDFETIGLWFAG